MNRQSKLVRNTGLMSLLIPISRKVLLEPSVNEDGELDLDEINNDQLDIPLVPRAVRNPVIVNPPNFVEPIRLNRFNVYFPDDVGIPTWAIQSISMPQWVGSWLPIEVKIMNIIGPSTIQPTYHNLIHKENFEMLIRMLDPTGHIVQQWTINVVDVQSINFGGVNDYSDNGISSIRVMLNVENCVLNF